MPSRLGRRTRHSRLGLGVQPNARGRVSAGTEWGESRWVREGVALSRGNVMLVTPMSCPIARRYTLYCIEFGTVSTQALQPLESVDNIAESCNPQGTSAPVSTAAKLKQATASGGWEAPPTSSSSLSPDTVGSGSKVHYICAIVARATVYRKA